MAVTFVPVSFRVRAFEREMPSYHADPTFCQIVMGVFTIFTHDDVDRDVPVSLLGQTVGRESLFTASLPVREPVSQ